MTRLRVFSNAQAALALSVVMALSNGASALVGDRDGAFGLDGYGRILTLGAFNLDPVFAATADTTTDFLAAGTLRFVMGGRPLDWLSYNIHPQFDITHARSITDGLTLLGSTAAGRYRIVDASWDTQFDNDRGAATLLLDRFNIKLVFPWADVVLGRQAITFGNAYLWNPLDVFRPFGAAQFTRDYKEGIDAVRVDVPAGDFSMVSLVFALGDADTDVWESGALVARYYGSHWGWDLSVQGGKLDGGYHAGLGLSGEMLGIETRAEGLYRWVDAGGPLDNTLTAVVGFGRSFDNTLGLEVEYLLNGGADADNLLQNASQVASGNLLQMSRHVLGVMAAYEFLPILRGSLVGLWSVSDFSGLIQAGVAYSLADEMELLVGMMLALGERAALTGTNTLAALAIDSEFGTYPHMAYLEFKGYF